MKKGCCVGANLACVLVVIGALNWGLVGAFEWNLVEALLGNWEWLERLVYVLVGLAGVVKLFGCPCKKCKGGAKVGGCCGPKKDACCGSGACGPEVKAGGEHPEGCEGDNCKM